jgi:hypothetical protein
VGVRKAQQFRAVDKCLTDASRNAVRRPVTARFPAGFKGGNGSGTFYVIEVSKQLASQRRTFPL